MGNDERSTALTVVIVGIVLVMIVVGLRFLYRLNQHISSSVQTESPSVQVKTDVNEANTIN